MALHPILEEKLNTALAPGVVATRMLGDYMGAPRGSGVDSTFGASPEKGAETSIYLAAAPE